MSRIIKAYRTRFHQMLTRAGARRVEQGVDWLVSKAQRLSGREKISLADALQQVFEWLATMPRLTPAHREHPRTPDEISFFCDSGLGGLARWLRAAGYRAEWEPCISDEWLLLRSRQQGSTILTTDSMLMERRLLRDKVILSLWLPPTLTIAEQLARVFREFELSVANPRCMSCGGELHAAPKETLHECIPPKTFRWLNEYFQCRECGKLFWHGTHWLRIAHRLKTLEPTGTR
jgi:uncharacterized protein with PIN domain